MSALHAIAIWNQSPSERRRKARTSWTALCVCWLLLAASFQSAAAEPPPLLVGKPFQKALEQPISATWERVDLRTIVRRIEGAQHTAILLDRRIDPSRERVATASGEPLLTFLERLAEQVEGRLSIVGNVAYLGPPEAALRLRTLIALRQQELQEDRLAVPRPRRAALLEPQSLAWEDGAQPTELVARLARQHACRVAGEELIPYDLWGGARLPGVNAIEALSLVLIQWNLTFQWIDAGRGIRLEPIPDRVGLERRHPLPKGVSAAAFIERWQEQFPSLEWRAAGKEVLVTAAIEVHEALEGTARQRPDRGTGVPGAGLKPLKQERYTLRMKDKPVSALLKMLAEPAHGQLQFEYDRQQLEAAGIDLDTRVTFEVKNGTIEQLLQSALEPLGLKFTLVDRIVRLSPESP
ncbi:MAG: STN domain-containing protein [Planctomycetales bacterium]